MTSPRKKQPVFKDAELNEPIEWDMSIEQRCPTALTHPDGFDGVKAWLEDETSKEKGRIALTLATKTLLLFRHYGIDPTCSAAWQELAMSLATDFVPGFRIVQPKKRGRKSKWEPHVLLSLWWEVQKRKGSKRAACFNLANKEPWKSLLGKVGLEARKERLYRAYQNEVPKCPLVEMAAKILEHPSSGAEMAQEFVDASEKAFADIKHFKINP